MKLLATRVLRFDKVRSTKQVLELYSSFSRQYLVKVVVQLKLAMINKPNIDIIINI